MTIQVVNLPIYTLIPAARNPNRMDPDRYALLREAIRRVGFLAPVLVRSFSDGNGDERYEIVDGHHRVEAAKELDMLEVPCIIRNGLDMADVELLRLGMNRLRGELDLAQVSAIMAELTTAGWSVEDLTVSGFTGSEIDDLLKAAAPMDDILSQPASVPDPEELPVDKPFVLEITFAHRDDYAHARKSLKKVGKGDLAAGLLRLLEE